MIVYCGLRHFYIHHFQPPCRAEAQDDVYFILTYNKKVWDFSPELKDYGFSIHSGGRTALHLDKPVLTLNINLADFSPFSRAWHDFSLQYTSELEVEYPHAWYLRFAQPTMLQQFLRDFREKLHQENWEGIWGAGQSKLVAKLAAHNLSGSERIIPPEQTQSFLQNLPLHRLPLDELDTLEKLGVKSLGQLAEIPLVELGSRFGPKAAALHQLGRGEDLVPFQPEQLQEHRWFLDCTVLEGYLRPLLPQELKPYLRQGVEALTAALQERQQIAGQVQVEAYTMQGLPIKRIRRLKEASANAALFLRTVENLLPQEPLAQVEVVLSGLEPSSAAQLSMFWEPRTPNPSEKAHLPSAAQAGIELPRRERLLLLWKECFT